MKYLLKTVTSGDNAKVISRTVKDINKKNAMNSGRVSLCSTLTIQAALREYPATVNVNPASKKLNILIRWQK